MNARTIRYFFIISIFISCSQKGNEDDKYMAHVSGDSIPVSQEIDSIKNDTIVKEENSTDFSAWQAGDWIKDNLNHPILSSSKVDRLIASKKLFKEPYDDGNMPTDYDVDYLKQNEIDQLNCREFLYYCFAYKNSFDQICAMPEEEDTTPAVPKIRAFLPFDWSGFSMSELQKKNIDKRKDSVIIILTQVILKYPNKIHCDYLDIICRLNAFTTIPALVKTASVKNRLNYTCLLDLMYDAKYPKFYKACKLFEDLYGDEAYAYGNRVVASKTNCAEVIKLANQYYATHIK